MTESQISIGDCVAGMASMEAGSVDVAVTSPPYNLGIDYGESVDDRRSPSDYLDWCSEWALGIHRVLKEDGSLFLNVGPSPSDQMLPHRVLSRMVRTEDGGSGGPFVLQNTFHWIKSVTVPDGNGDPTTKGHFKPINSPRYVNGCTEFVFHLTKSGRVPLDRKAIGVPYEHKGNLSRWGHTEGEDVRCRGTNWFIPYRTIQSRKGQRPHPATFPVELPRNCILIHGVGRPVVMDPFMGIGSSWIAAIDCAASRFVGFEIEAEFVKEARRRAQEAQMSLRAS